jgi:hypothetical protein
MDKDVRVSMTLFVLSYMFARIGHIRENKQSINKFVFIFPGKSYQEISTKIPNELE